MLPRESQQPLDHGVGHERMVVGQYGGQGRDDLEVVGVAGGPGWCDAAAAYGVDAGGAVGADEGPDVGVHDSNVEIHVEAVGAVPGPGYVSQVGVVHLSHGGPDLGDHPRPIGAHDRGSGGHVLGPECEGVEAYAAVGGAVELGKGIVQVEEVEDLLGVELAGRGHITVVELPARPPCCHGAHEARVGVGRVEVVAIQATYSIAVADGLIAEGVDD